MRNFKYKQKRFKNKYVYKLPIDNLFKQQRKNIFVHKAIIRVHARAARSHGYDFVLDNNLSYMCFRSRSDMIEFKMLFSNTW